MKVLFFLVCITISCTLFALGQTDCGSQSSLMTKQNHEMESNASEQTVVIAQDEFDQDQKEALIVTGGYEEVDVTACDPGLLEFVNQYAGDYEERIGIPGNEDNHQSREVIRVFRQVVRGLKFVTCVKLSDEALAIIIIHKDISGDFSLLESYHGTEIFKYLADFLLGKVKIPHQNSYLINEAPRASFKSKMEEKK